MSVFCIYLSVLLVTAIFGMADMYIQSQLIKTKQEDGNWHIALKNISRDCADEVNSRKDVTAVGSASVFNLDGAQPYRVNEKRAALYGL